MKTKKNIILFILIICCSFVQATILKSSISVNELDGTNGVTFYDSLMPKYGTVEISFIDSSIQDNIIISGSSNIFLILKMPNIPLYNVRLFNNSNGIISIESARSIMRRKPIGWSSDVSWAAISDVFMHGQRPFHIFSSPKASMPPVISLTNSLWEVSQKIYITNNPPNSTPLLFDNFFKSNTMCISYYSTKGGTVVMPINTIETSIKTRIASETNIVQFIGYSAGQYYSAAVGDVNNDGYGDLFLGSVWNHDECWIVFGGRNWTGNVDISSLGTNGVTFFSENDCENDVASVGDINDDGIQDIAYLDCNYDYIEMYYYYHVTIAYGRTNWPTRVSYKNLNNQTGFIIPLYDGYPVAIAGQGDVNGDGHEDLGMVDWLGTLYLMYGGPFIKPSLALNGTNGFIISDNIYMASAGNADNNGDVNNDGYNDIIYTAISYYESTNYAHLIYGGQSPSAPPALRTPLWINVGESNSLTFEIDTVPTNIIWTGCKKGDDYTLCYTNGARCTTWDIPMGELWFTNSYTISNTSEIFSISYTSTNALGPAIGFTTLTLEPVPEPLTTGIVFLTAALIGKAFSNKFFDAERR